MNNTQQTLHAGLYFGIPGGRIKPPDGIFAGLMLDEVKAQDNLKEAKKLGLAKPDEDQQNWLRRLKAFGCGQGGEVAG